MPDVEPRTSERIIRLGLSDFADELLLPPLLRRLARLRAPLTRGDFVCLFDPRHARLGIATSREACWRSGRSNVAIVEPTRASPPGPSGTIDPLRSRPRGVPSVSLRVEGVACHPDGGRTSQNQQNVASALSHASCARAFLPDCPVLGPSITC
ncbi:hypothetical protein WMF27_34210 [Sorangium sp. So ce281]|uniref:hypothetical protein n=1 Tax=unclassified Sorangium TaxID=2621164 RepID=UPI003F5E02F6